MFVSVCPWPSLRDSLCDVFHLNVSAFLEVAMTTASHHHYSNTEAIY